MISVYLIYSFNSASIVGIDDICLFNSASIVGIEAELYVYLIYSFNSASIVGIDEKCWKAELNKHISSIPTIKAELCVYLIPTIETELYVYLIYSFNSASIMGIDDICLFNLFI